MVSGSRGRRRDDTRDNPTGLNARLRQALHLASHAPADPEQAGTEQCHRLRLGHAVACDVQSPFVQTSPQPPTVVHVPACESRFVPNRNDTSVTSGADVSPVNANVNVTGPTSNGLCWWLLNPP